MGTQQRNSTFQNAIGQWFLRASTRVGIAGLPFQIRALLVLGFAFSLGRNIAFPYLAMFLTGSSDDGGLQFDPSIVGSMIMIGGLTYTLALLVTGSLCDRFGRKRMMVASMIVQAILTAGYAYITTYFGVMLLYSITGIAGAFYDPAFSAMVADLVQPERREEVYGLSYMISNIGTVVGPIIGGIVASASGYSILYVYAALFTAATATGLILLTKESRPANVIEVSLSQFAGIFRDKIFMLFCFLGAMTNFVYSQLYGLLSVYTQYMGFEPYIFGVFFAVNGAMVVTLQIPIRRGTAKIGPSKAFIIAQLLYAAGFSYFMFATGFYEFLAGIVVLTLGEITFFPASSGFVANLAPPDMRGRYMAMLGLFFGVGGSAGAQIAFSAFGILADKRFVWGILGSIGFATLLGYGLLLRMTNKDKQTLRRST